MNTFLSKLKDGVLGFLSFCGKRQMIIQSSILWVLALFNLFTDQFWLFAIPAIILSGMEDIITELRKLNSNNNG